LKVLDADVLCSDGGGRYWHHLIDLSDQARASAAPAECAELHQALLDALATSEVTVLSQGWLCETCAAFGQPARLCGPESSDGSAQVRLELTT